MPPNLASLARVFRIGLEAGICTADEAREWALSVIAQMDAPPGEMIEVSWRKPLAYLIEDLNEVQGDVDLDFVCRRLLERVLLSMSPSNDHLADAIRQALHVAQSVGNRDFYDALDRIDDGLQLATAGVYGTVDEWRHDFEREISDRLV